MPKHAAPQLALLATLFASLPAVAAQKMPATIVPDEPGAFSCASRKQVAVRVQAPKDTLPEPRYQYTVGGDLHVLCADVSGAPPATGTKVRISFRGDAVQIVQ